MTASRAPTVLKRIGKERGPSLNELVLCMGIGVDVLMDEVVLCTGIGVDALMDEVVLRIGERSGCLDG